MRVGPRAKLLLLASLFVLPIVVSVVAYLFFPPAPTANYGELLLPPQALPEGVGKPERWTLLAAEASPCDPGCLEKIAAMRQVRLALGRNASRVEALVLAPEAIARAGVAIDAGHIYLADPHGNVMMRWPARPDRKRMLRDLERLLKASQIG